MLAHIARVLGDAQVNILAFLTTTSGSKGLNHLIVDRSETAKKAFASAELVCTEADVRQLELPNTPGALAKFARKLAEEYINITLGYATSEKGSKKACVVLAVSDVDKAITIDDGVNSRNTDIRRCVHPPLQRSHCRRRMRCLARKSREHALVNPENYR